MGDNETISRRTVIKVGGAVGVGALLAGCTGDDGGAESVEIDPGTTIVFNGLSSSWEGKQPADIDGVDNPTLVLEEGGEYEIGWDEGDGAPHNIAIRDDSGNVIDDLATETVSTPDDEQFLTFEASSEMADYVCEPHLTDMVGQIDVE